MELLQQITALKSITENVADVSWQNELQELSDKLLQNKFYVVVVGMFKRGKSSIINALLEKNIAPVAVTPLTAIVTIFDYNEEGYAEVFFDDGSGKQISIEELGKYVSEEENPANEKKVKLVKVYDNAELLKSTSLADTPGLGSAFEHNTETTLRFIPKIDAALFVLSADIPISKIDLELLDSLRQNTSAILFVQNKADLLDETNLQKVVTHNKKIISGKMGLLPDDIDLCVISAKRGEIYNAGLSRLRENILQLVASEKQSLITQNVIRRLNNIISLIKVELQLRLDTWIMPVSELENKYRQFQDSVVLMQTQKEEFEAIINAKIKLLQAQIDSQMNTLAKDLKDKVQAKLQDTILTPPFVNKDKDFIKLKAGAEKLILGQFNDVKEAIEITIKANFKTLLKEHGNRSQSFLNEMISKLQSLMGISFNMIADTFDLDVYTAFYLSLDSGKDNIVFNKPLLYHLLPASTWRKKVFRQLSAHYNEVIIRNTSSVIYDLQYKIQESFRKFSYDFNKRLQSLLGSIENILQETLQNKKSTASEIEIKTEPLKQAFLKIDILSDKLPAINTG